MRYLSFLYIFCCSLFCDNVAFAQTKTLYVGSYTKTDSKGIYQFSFDCATGILKDKKLSYPVENPTFIVAHPTKDILYSISKLNKYQQTANGAVTAFKIGKKKELIKLSEHKTNGKSPCHLAYNDTTKQLFVSNYQGGTLSIHPTDTNGNLLEASQIIDFNSTTTKAHTHAAKYRNKELFVADLGVNTVTHYALKKGKYECLQNIPFKENSGPRHLELTEDGRFIYVINEYASSISVLEKKGRKYKIKQDISTLVPGFKDKNTAADIHLSADEKYVYGTNRGENTLVVFERDLKKGTLTKIQSVGTRGECPRNFTFDPTGKYLLIANKISNSIAVFDVDKKSGKIKFKHSTKSPMPTCLTFVY
jgi:6-phosphogluconolactonase